MDVPMPPHATSIDPGEAGVDQGRGKTGEGWAHEQTVLGRGQWWEWSLALKPDPNSWPKPSGNLHVLFGSAAANRGGWGIT